jgi:hypothetical protein
MNLLAKSVGASALALTLLAGTGTVAAAASPAMTPWYCGDSCDGQNPATYNASGTICADDATTVSSKAYQGYTLQLRYSANCQTIWGRLVAAYNDEYLGLEMWAGSTLGWRDLGVTYEIEDPADQNWGWMYNDHNVTIRTCLRSSWYSADITCTGGY